MTMTETKKKPHSTGVLRVLTLDGGGAKGFYTLGVLEQGFGLRGQVITSLRGCLREPRCDSTSTL